MSQYIYKVIRLLTYMSEVCRTLESVFTFRGPVIYWTVHLVNEQWRKELEITFTLKSHFLLLFLSLCPSCVCVLCVVCCVLCVVCCVLCVVCSLKNIMGPLHLTMSDVSADLNNLVKTFRSVQRTTDSHTPCSLPVYQH